jgi:hypothetical protein
MFFLSTEFNTKDNLPYQFYPVISGELNISVRASNDAHVALTTGSTEGGPMYEVSNMIVYLKTLNSPFLFSPHSLAVFVASINVCICS